MAVERVSLNSEKNSVLVSNLHVTLYFGGVKWERSREPPNESVRKCTVGTKEVGEVRAPKIQKLQGCQQWPAAGDLFIYYNKMHCNININFF